MTYVAWALGMSLASIAVVGLMEWWDQRKDRTKGEIEHGSPLDLAAYRALRGHHEERRRWMP